MQLDRDSREKEKYSCRSHANDSQSANLTAPQPACHHSRPHQEAVGISNKKIVSGCFCHFLAVFGRFFVFSAIFWPFWCVFWRFLNLQDAETVSLVIIPLSEKTQTGTI